MKKVLAVDYGAKHIGLASGDDSNRIAFPRDVIMRRDDDQALAALLDVVREGEYGMVVFGAPLNMDGGKSRQYEVTMEFVEKFRVALVAGGEKVGREVTVEVIDERLSSFEADEMLEGFEGTGMRKKEGDRDVMAAKVILERWLEGGV
jgi:putative holliday junction resolvase